MILTIEQAFQNSLAFLEVGNHRSRLTTQMYSFLYINHNGDLVNIQDAWVISDGTFMVQLAGFEQPVNVPSNTKAHFIDKSFFKMADLQLHRINNNLLALSMKGVELGRIELDAFAQEVSFTAGDWNMLVEEGKCLTLPSIDEASWYKKSARSMAILTTDGDDMTALVSVNKTCGRFMVRIDYKEFLIIKPTADRYVIHGDIYTEEPGIDAFGSCALHFITILTALSLRAVLFQRRNHMDKTADKFRQMADGMQKEIDDKFRDRPTHTRRMAQMDENARKEGLLLQKLQAKLRGIADARDTGTLPQSLDKLTTKKAVQHIFYWKVFPDWSADARKEMLAYGISDKAQFEQTRTDLLAIGDPQAGEKTAADKIRDLERDLVGSDIPGYFPTPAPIATSMVNMADIRDGETILEPSAGKGNIADAVRELHPSNPLEVIELNWTLSKILIAKGYNVVESDFMAHRKEYDVILMNPPFENLQDIEHVRHAYELLSPTGRLVAIMSEAGYFRKDKKAAEFRLWIEELRYTHTIMIKELGQAFKTAERPTGVFVRQILIQKPNYVPYYPKNADLPAKIERIPAPPAPPAVQLHSVQPQKPLQLSLFSD